MEPTAEGRMCSACEKVVVDFSGMTDAELLNYFLSAKTIPCGRFHRSQLNIPLSPLKPVRRTFATVYKQIAAVFAFLTLKPSGAVAQGQPRVVMQSIPNKISQTNSGSTIISGSVKDVHGEPLGNAVVNLDDMPTAVCNDSGRFEFGLPASSAGKTAVITFSYPGLVTVARSFHPAMGSTSYSIVMAKPYEMQHAFYSGFPLFEPSETNTAICFRPNQYSITDSLKRKLESLAMELRNNPSAGIDLTGYATSPSELRLMKQRQAAIKRYLMEKEGIAEERISSAIQGSTSELRNTITITGR